MMQIEKGIPYPGDSRGQKKYPFAEMQIGDSFFIAGNPDEVRTKMITVNQAAYQFSKRNDQYKFSCRRVDGGFRCWRIEAEEK